LCRKKWPGGRGGLGGLPFECKRENEKRKAKPYSFQKKNVVGQSQRKRNLRGKKGRTIREKDQESLKEVQEEQTVPWSGAGGEKPKRKTISTNRAGTEGGGGAGHGRSHNSRSQNRRLGKTLR